MTLSLKTDIIDLLYIIYSFIHSFIKQAFVIIHLKIILKTFFNCKLILMQMHMNKTPTFKLILINLKFSCSTVEIFTC
ncbi:hypothetical protein T05_866 [Trichinella murrelli]|uniref:Uncharacterized protein n=1 Tax=Trichinella murrelli TaxID=144512 RepID=A0A0V0TC08_9BILA|nr:hypothetical protein T05_866 [Trichinella murrelli]